MITEQTITITVETTRGTKTLTVEKTIKVSELIAKVVALCGFNPGDRFDLFLKTDLQNPLQPERPLVSYHIENGAILVLSQVGSGV